MGKSVKKALKEEYNRLKKAMEKIVSPKKQQAHQLIWQPVRTKNMRGNLR